MAQVQNATAGTLLGFLLDGPKTGWELDSGIEGSVGEFWNVTRSQVYRELRHLADDGLVRVRSAGARARVPHEITASGRKAFTAWLQRDLPPESRRVPILLTVFFGEHLAPDRLRELLVTHRLENREAMERYRALEPVLARAPWALATARYGVAYTEMVERWIDDVAMPLVT